MITVHRAMLAEDKELRRSTILDAAEALILGRLDRLPSVDEVAAQAGLSKGTVYLYFGAKEDILLALHERHKDGFFQALIERAEAPEPMTLDTMVELTHRYITGVAGFLPIASLSFGFMEKSVTESAARAFMVKMGDQLARAGAGVERHFRLPNGEGVRLLGHSYGLIVGLWQMAASDRQVEAGLVSCPLTRTIYPAEVEQGLRDLWNGRLARLAEPVPPASL